MKLDDQTKREVRQIAFQEVQRLFAQADSVRRQVKQRHIEADIIFRGLAADRPDGSSEVKAYFATDSGVLSIWTGSAWFSTTLS